MKRHKTWLVSLALGLGILIGNPPFLQAHPPGPVTAPNSRPAFTPRAPVLTPPLGPNPTCHDKTGQLLGLPPARPIGGADIRTFVTNPGNRYLPTTNLTANHPNGSVVIFSNGPNITHSAVKVNGAWVQYNRPAPTYGIKSGVTTASSINGLQNTYFRTNDGRRVPAGWNRATPQVYVPGPIP